MRKAFVEAVSTRTLVVILDESVKDTGNLYATIANGRCEFRAPASVLGHYSSCELSDEIIVNAVFRARPDLAPKRVPKLSSSSSSSDSAVVASEPAKSSQKGLPPIDEGEIRVTLPNGMMYLVQNGVPYEVIDSKSGFQGFDPKMKYIMGSIKQWFNPEDYDEESMPDEYKDIAQQIFAMTGKSAESTQMSGGVSIMQHTASTEKKLRQCKICKGSRKSSSGNKCGHCKGAGMK
jgi:hypothetical protein